MTDTQTLGHLRPDHEDCECVEGLDHDLYVCGCPGYPQLLHPDSCVACGSEVRGERGYVPGFTGMPVTCGDEWHDEEGAP